jgi:hypothetical protein
MLAQAAAAAWVGACEEMKQEVEQLRIDKSNELYSEHLKLICGENGNGDGKRMLYGMPAVLPFPTKKRPLSQGGDFTFAKSCAMRTEGRSIMMKGKEVVRKICNVYEPLAKRFLNGNQVRAILTYAHTYAI